MTTSATPAMRQYLDAKQQHRDAILFFRMGDFYEMFYEDALVASRALELTLTSRSKDANGGGIPMCGVPFHAVDGYIARLVRKGFRVAICDQVEDPRKAKGIVKREVVRVVSPGTLTDSSYLDAREPAFLMAIAAASTARPGDTIGVALLDVSTGEFTAAEYTGADGMQALADELAVLEAARDRGAGSRRRSGSDSRRAGGWPTSRRRLRSRHSTGGRSTARRRAARCSISCAPPGSKGSVWIVTRRGRCRGRAGALPARTQKADLAHVRAVAYRQRADCAPDRSRPPSGISRFSKALKAGAKDRCSTSSTGPSRRSAAGCCARGCCVRSCRSMPFAIGSMRSKSSPFVTTERGKFRDAIKVVQDLERLVARAALGTAGPRDLIGLKQSLAVVPRVGRCSASCRRRSCARSWRSWTICGHPRPSSRTR